METEMATAELASESTHEDIEAAVEQIVEERSTEDKDDSQLLAEEHDEPTTEVAEDESGNEDTALEGEESTGDESPEWLDDDIKAEVAAYGISEEDLAEFTSREELDRALKFLSKNSLEAGKEPAEEESAEKPVREGQYDVSLDKDIYDEDLVDEFSRMRDHYESRLEAIEAKFDLMGAHAEEQSFDRIVDNLGHADLFGKSGKESDKERQRRKDLFDAQKAQRPRMSEEAAIRFAMKGLFSDELTKKELKKRTRQVSRQSNSRQGGSVTRPSDPGESLRDEMRQAYKELDSTG